MTALTADRDTITRELRDRILPVKGGVKIYAGAIVAIDSTGYAVKGATSTTLKAVAGRAAEQVDNTGGADGALFIKVRIGHFRYANSASTDAITLTELDQACYLVDDQTVAKTSGSATRVQAGIVRDVDTSGVWVEFGGAR